MQEKKPFPAQKWLFLSRVKQYKYCENLQIPQTFYNILQPANYAVLLILRCSF